MRVNSMVHNPFTGHKTDDTAYRQFLAGKGVFAPRTSAAVRREGPPFQMIKPPVRAAAPTKRLAGGRSDGRGLPMFEDDYLEDGKGLDKFRRNGTQPGDRQPEDGPVPTPHVDPDGYDPYPDGKPGTGGASLAALCAENTRLRAEIARREKALKATAAKPGPALLTGREREEMDRAMGIDRMRSSGPGRDEAGRFVIGVETPTQTRARLARSAGRAV
ncbi:hypothetical protein WMF18_28960 [Sorangium sp. So ce315]|uniref:hypothetical protein n=1 Tax=Sorangium sp. So ce315 TaxID=3133299 RepID=UPI003F61A2AD